MRRRKSILISTVLLSLAGAAISYSLLVKHLDKATGLAWFDSTCEGGDVGESRRSCDRVMASKWGTFPPVPNVVAPEKQDEPVEVLGLFDMQPRPVALFGMLYFSLLVVWYAAIGYPSYQRRLWQLVPLIFNVLGVIGALFYSGLMFFTELQFWCPWCLVAHLCNGMMLIGSLLLWPRPHRDQAERPLLGKLSAGDPFGGAAAPRAAANPSALAATTCLRGSGGGSLHQATRPERARSIRHPTGRLVVVTLGGIVALVSAEWFYYGYARELRSRQGLRIAYDRLDREIDQVRNHAKSLYSMFQDGEKKEIWLRYDDPHVGVSRPPSLRVSVWEMGPYDPASLRNDGR